MLEMKVERGDTGNKKVIARRGEAEGRGGQIYKKTDMEICFLKQRMTRKGWRYEMEGVSDIILFYLKII